MRPRLLDLFCGAGGAAMGYHRAGFDVVGVDIEPQPNYPFEFIQEDALWLLADWEEAGWISAPWIDAVHASPPCQGYTTMNNRHGSLAPLHLQDVKTFCRNCPRPSVIENVPGARSELDHPVQLCGSSFGLRLSRHRLFECSFPVLALECQHKGDEVPVYGKLDGRRLWSRADGSELRAPKTLKVAQGAMGIDWMEWDELREAIPPAYTEHIGYYLMKEVEARRKAAA